jgi:hypothetical protein
MIARIVAQRGAFTVFGKKIKPMEIFMWKIIIR